jgi:hypothetical protein
MNIYIPSMRRADKRVLSGPAAHLPPTVTPVYVVPGDERAIYTGALEHFGLKARVMSPPSAVKGIAATREWIGQWAAAQGEDKFIMADDDITFLVRQDRNDFRLRLAEQADVRQMLDWIWHRLDTHEHVGISGREGNNRIGNGDMDDLVDFNNRTIRLLAYQTKAFLEVEHGRVVVMEDFDVNLQILRKGGSIAVSYWFAQGQRMTGETGGCSTYRNHAVHEASARRLAELHPGFVTLRDKANKTDAEGFGTRKECTIQWKRAHQAGQHAKQFERPSVVS